MSMLEQLAESSKTLSPNAYKIASLGHLNSLVGAMYGFDNITHKEASVIMGTRFKMERDRVKTAMESISDCVEGLHPDTKIKIAACALCPDGVMPEAWNFMRVEKVGMLLDVADLASKCGEVKLAKEALAEHDRLAELAFDYFNTYSSKMASSFEDHLRRQEGEVQTKVAGGILGKTKDLAQKVFQNEKVKEYGGTALKGLIGGTAAAAGAAPIINYVGKNVTDDAITNARDKALQTAAGTAGIAVGANQLNNLLNRFTTERTAGVSTEEPATPFEKMAFHFLLDKLVTDDGVRRQNKIACVHAIHEFVEEETPMFEKIAMTPIELSLAPGVGALGGLMGSGLAGGDSRQRGGAALGGGLGALLGTAGAMSHDMRGVGGLATALGGLGLGAIAGHHLAGPAKEANMFNPSQNQNDQQGMAGGAVQTPQYPMGAGGTPMAGDSASTIGNAAAGGAGAAAGSGK